MSRFPNLCAPKSKRPLPNSRNNLTYGSMIPNSQFLCALNPICSRFLKKHAPEIPIDPNFQAAVILKFQQLDHRNFWKQKGQHDCDWCFRRREVGSLVMVVGILKSWHNTTVRVKVKYPKGRLIENRLLYNDFVNA